MMRRLLARLIPHRGEDAAAQALPLIVQAKKGQRAALTAATRLVMAADDHRENVETIRHRIELREGGKPQRLDSAEILEATAAVAALARKHR